MTLSLTRNEKKALRLRIKEVLPEILEILSSEVRPEANIIDPRSDDRPGIIGTIVEIATLEEARLTHEKFAEVAEELQKAAEKLPQEVKVLTEYASFTETLQKAASELQKTIKYTLPEYRGFTEALEEIKVNAKIKAKSSKRKSNRSPTIDWLRVVLAAKVAFHLLEENHVEPTLSDGGPYVTVTSKLFEAAMDRESGTAMKACKLHFENIREWYEADVPEDAGKPVNLTEEELEAERKKDPYPYSRRRGRRRRRRPPQSPTTEPSRTSEISRMMEEDSEMLHKRREKQMRSWPDLDQLLDELLR